MKKTIAFQGSIGANSHIACQKFSSDFEPKSFATFADVFQAVKSGEIACGMVPLENSYAGRVAEIHQLLQRSDLSIISEHFLKIDHVLAGIEGSSLESVKKVYSHPQALMQCQQHLQDLKLETQEFSNTAEAAKYVAQEGRNDKAAICSKAAAELNGLKILKEKMQDDEENFTVFVVIAKQQQDVDPAIAPVIMSMIFTVRNINGALYKALSGFATNGVNMLKIESYIPSGASKEANFFISVEGHPSQKNVVLALEELGFFSKSVKLLGVYYADKSRGL